MSYLNCLLFIKELYSIFDYLNHFSLLIQLRSDPQLLGHDPPSGLPIVKHLVQPQRRQLSPRGLVHLILRLLGDVRCGFDGVAWRFGALFGDHVLNGALSAKVLGDGFWWTRIGKCVAVQLIKNKIFRTYWTATNFTWKLCTVQYHNHRVLKYSLLNNSVIITQNHYVHLYDSKLQPPKWIFLS